MDRRDPARCYVPGGKVAHICIDEGLSFSECGLWYLAGFHGTGAQHEYEQAAALPLCKKCAKARPDIVRLFSLDS